MKAHRRWPGGIYALWYPIKDRAAVARFAGNLRKTGIPKILDIRFGIRPPSAEPRLDGTGMIIVNPPYTLEGELRVLLPALMAALAESPGARMVAGMAGRRHDAQRASRLAIAGRNAEFTPN